MTEKRQKTGENIKALWPGFPHVELHYLGEKQNVRDTVAHYSNGWCTDRKFCCHWLAVLHKLIKIKNLLWSQEWLQATTCRTNESNHQKQSLCTEEYYAYRLSSKHTFCFGQNVGEDLLRDHCVPFWTEAWSHPSFCWMNYLKMKTFTVYSRVSKSHFKTGANSSPFLLPLSHQHLITQYFTNRHTHFSSTDVLFKMRWLDAWQAPAN